MRKLLFSIIGLFFIAINLNAQDNSLGTEQVKMLSQYFQKLNPTLYEIKSDGSFDLKFNTFRGSPYENNKFVVGSVIDGIKKTQSKMYLRYNMYSDEIEIKTNIYIPKAEALIKEAGISCILNNISYYYLGFINEKGTKKYGYLKLIYKGSNYSLYQRLSSHFIPKEDSHDNSYRQPKPASFEKKATYYLKHGNNISFLPTRKKLLYKNYSEMSNILKSYIKKTHPSLKNKSDLIGLVRFLDTKN